MILSVVGRVQIYLWDLKCLHLAVIESNVCRAHHHHISPRSISVLARACVCARTQSFWRRAGSVWKSAAVVLIQLFTDCPPHIKSQPTDGWPLPSHRIAIIIIIISLSLVGRRYCYHYLVAATNRRARAERVCPGFWSICGGHSTHRHREKPHCYIVCYQFQFEVLSKRKITYWNHIVNNN